MSSCFRQMKGTLTWPAFVIEYLSRAIAVPIAFFDHGPDDKVPGDTIYDFQGEAVSLNMSGHRAWRTILPVVQTTVPVEH